MIVLIILAYFHINYAAAQIDKAHLNNYAKFIQNDAKITKFIQNDAKITNNTWNTPSNSYILLNSIKFQEIQFIQNLSVISILKIVFIILVFSLFMNPNRDYQFDFMKFLIIFFVFYNISLSFDIGVDSYSYLIKTEENYVFNNMSFYNLILFPYPPTSLFSPLGLEFRNFTLLLFAAQILALIHKSYHLFIYLYFGLPLMHFQ